MYKNKNTLHSFMEKVSLSINNHFKVPCYQIRIHCLFYGTKLAIYSKNKTRIFWDEVILDHSWLLANFVKLGWSRKLKKFKTAQVLKNFAVVCIQEYEVHFLKIALKKSSGIIGSSGLHLRLTLWYLQWMCWLPEWVCP